MRSIPKTPANRRNPRRPDRATLELRRQRDRQRLEYAWRLLGTPAAADAAVLGALVALQVRP